MAKNEVKKAEPGIPAGEWGALFRKAGVQVNALDAAKSQRAQATIIGNFLSQNLERRVPIEAQGRMGSARLLATDAGKRQRRYYFEVQWEGGTSQSSSPETETGAEDAPIAPIAPSRTPQARAAAPGPQRKTGGKASGRPKSTPAAPKRKGPLTNEEDWA